MLLLLVGAVVVLLLLMVPTLLGRLDEGDRQGRD
jgi:hypothetical protein